MRQLLLQLVVKREALGTVLRSRSEDIGQSSVNTLSSNLSYNLGVYNNQLRNGGSNTSSYLSLNNVTSCANIMWCSTARCTGSVAVNRTVNYIKRCMNAILPVTDLPVECSTPNLQSLGPMTAISAGKIYGLSRETSQLHHLRQQPVSHASDRLYRRRAKYISPVMGGY